MLMRLARGSGLDGLSAMAPMRHWLGVDWIRPMLELRRDDLRNWLNGRGVSWADDPTNEDDRYDRVKARKALMILAPLGIDAPGLAETARRLSTQRAALDAVMEAHLVRTVTWGEFGEASLDVAALTPCEPEIARRIMSCLLRYVSARDYPPRHRALALLMEDIHCPNFRGATLGGCMVQPDGTRRLICREPAAIQDLHTPWNGNTSWDGRWAITGPPGADLQIGALGAPGVAHLRAAEGNGWKPPQAWKPTPRPVRLTLPAIWQSVGENPPKLAAVPSINYVNPQIEGLNGAWTAKLIMRHDALFR